MNTRTLTYSILMAAILLFCVVPMASALAGPSTTVDATIRITPNTLNIDSHGTVTAFITFPDEYDEIEVLPEFVTCEGNDMVKGIVVRGNGHDYLAKFNAEDFSELTPGDEVTLTVRGQAFFDDELIDFEGSDVIRVIENGKNGKLFQNKNNQ